MNNIHFEEFVKFMETQPIELNKNSSRGMTQTKVSKWLLVKKIFLVSL